MTYYINLVHTTKKFYGRIQLSKISFISDLKSRHTGPACLHLPPRQPIFREKGCATYAHISYNLTHAPHTSFPHTHTYNFLRTVAKHRSIRHFFKNLSQYYVWEDVKFSLILNICFYNRTKLLRKTGFGRMLGLEVILWNIQIVMKILPLNIQPSAKLAIIKLCLGPTY